MRVKTSTHSYLMFTFEVYSKNKERPDVDTPEITSVSFRKFISFITCFLFNYTKSLKLND